MNNKKRDNNNNEGNRMQKINIKKSNKKKESKNVITLIGKTEKPRNMKIKNRNKNQFHALAHLLNSSTKRL